MDLVEDKMVYKDSSSWRGMDSDDTDQIQPVCFLFMYFMVVLSLVYYFLFVFCALHNTKGQTNRCAYIFSQNTTNLKCFCKMFWLRLAYPIFGTQCFVYFPFALCMSLCIIYSRGIQYYENQVASLEEINISRIYLQMRAGIYSIFVLYQPWF